MKTGRPETDWHTPASLLCPQY